MVDGSVTRTHHKAPTGFERLRQIVFRPADGLGQAMAQSEEGRDGRREGATRAVRVLRPDTRRSEQAHPISHDKKIGRRIPLVRKVAAFEQNGAARLRAAQGDQFAPDVVRHTQRRSAAPQATSFWEVGCHEGAKREKAIAQKGQG